MRYKALILSLMLLVVVDCTYGAVHHVTEGGSGKRDGSSWNNAFGGDKLIALLANFGAAKNGDNVYVAAGTYSPGAGSFILIRGVSVYGGFPPVGSPDIVARDWTRYPTILDGGGRTKHVIKGSMGATSGDTRIDGFFITGGAANSTVSSAAADRKGAGMLNSSSSPTVANCFFYGNRAVGSALECGGGGMANLGGASPLITGCTFTENSASGGSGYGGAIINEAKSFPVIINSTFSGNSASFGGAIRNNKDSGALIINSSFAENRAEGGKTGSLGGAIYSQVQSSVKAVNCIFWGNSAQSKDAGPDIYVGTSSIATISNCVILDRGIFAYGSVVSQDCISAAPRLVSLDTRLTVPASPADVYVYDLMYESSAVGAAASGAPITDQLGRVRPNPNKASGRADIGAVERYAVLAGISINPASATIYEGETVRLGYTITPGDAQSDVVWSSSDTGVASSDRHGTVTAIGAGSARITASAASNPSVFAVCRIDVIWAEPSEPSVSPTVPPAPSVSPTATPGPTISPDPTPPITQAPEPSITPGPPTPEPSVPPKPSPSVAPSSTPTPPPPSEAPAEPAAPAPLPSDVPAPTETISPDVPEPSLAPEAQPPAAKTAEDTAGCSAFSHAHILLLCATFMIAQRGK